MAGIRKRLLGRILHVFYLSSLTVQALIGTSQLLGAISLQIAIRTGWVEHIVRLTGQEIAEDPTDPFARLLSHLIAGGQHAGVAGSDVFWSIYLFGHGLLNLFVVGALMAKRPWAHPVSMAVLSGFIVYQMNRWAHTHAPLMIVLSLFDAVVIALVWREYRTRRG